jgi:hypothetical protein
MSSNSITTAIESCEQEARTTAPSLLASPEMLRTYCSCTADAIVYNKGDAPLELEKHLTTYVQLEKCARFAKSASPGTTRTPFSRGRWSASEVARQVLACERRIDKPTSLEYRVGYCGCFVDALRARKDRPLVTTEEDELCRNYGRGQEVGSKVTNPSGEAKPAVILPPRAAGSGWFCIKSLTIEDMSSCFRTSQQCEVTRQRLVSGGLQYAGCLGQGGAACFTYDSVVNQKDSFDCSATLAACERQRRYGLNQTRDVRNVSACGVVL